MNSGWFRTGADVDIVMITVRDPLGTDGPVRIDLTCAAEQTDKSKFEIESLH